VSAPTARWFPALAFHPPSGTTLLYGGRGGGADQLWSYDGATWTRLCDACPPGDRVAAALEYDSHNGRLLLFGGAASYPFDSATFRNDVWEWNGSVWSELVTSGTRPSARAAASTAFDSTRGRLVVFGGETVAGKSDELFELDGDAWVEPVVATPSPTARSVAGAAFDLHRGTTVVFGGDSGSYRDDAWEWDGSAWVEICTTCTGTARAFVPLAYYPPRRQLLIIGGWNGDEIAGTWARDDTTFSMVSNEPGKRDSMAVSFDPIRQRLVLFGGNGDSCGGDCGDTWEYGVFP
jgi:hypothetical protein